MQQKKKNHKITIKEISPSYNFVLTKKVGNYKKGEKLFLINLNIDDFSKVLGNNGYPFGYCGHIGDFPTTFSKEILENIIVIKQFETITTTTQFYKIEDFK